MRYEIRCGAPAAPDVCLAWWCNDLFAALLVCWPENSWLFPWLFKEQPQTLPPPEIACYASLPFRKPSLANLIKIRILKGGEYSVGVYPFPNFFFLQLF